MMKVGGVAVKKVKMEDTPFFCIFDEANAACNTAAAPAKRHFWAAMGIFFLHAHFNLALAERLLTLFRNYFDIHSHLIDNHSTRRRCDAAVRPHFSIFRASVCHGEEFRDPNINFVLHISSRTLR